MLYCNVDLAHTLGRSTLRFSSFLSIDLPCTIAMNKENHSDVHQPLRVKHRDHRHQSNNRRIPFLHPSIGRSGNSRSCFHPHHHLRHWTKWMPYDLLINTSIRFGFHSMNSHKCFVVRLLLDLYYDSDRQTRMILISIIPPQICVSIRRLDLRGQYS